MGPPILRNPWGQRYVDGGYVPRSDWTNVHLGYGAAKNVDADFEHGLSLPLAFLDVTVLASVTGGGGFIAFPAQISADFSPAVNVDYGIEVTEVDHNAIVIQTGLTGFLTIDSSGTIIVFDTDDAFYRVIVVEKIRPELVA